MSLCASSVLMSALTVGLILSDISYSRDDRVIPHLFLGGIATLLFYSLCGRGYEIINWVLLSIVPVYIFIVWAMQSVQRETPQQPPLCNRCMQPKRSCNCNSPQQPPLCNRCMQPKRSCDCQAPPLPPPRPCRPPPPPPSQGCTKYLRPRETHQESSSNIAGNCPANPISLSTECGISRYT